MVGTLTLAGLSVSAGNFTLIEQSGTISVTANGTTTTESLPRLSSADSSLTAGTPGPGMDYAMATAQSSLHAGDLHITLTATVGEWGNEGQAEARIVVTFGVDQNTIYAVPVEKAEAHGQGWCGNRSFILLSNDDGVIFRRDAGGGYNSCNFDHPDFATLCTNRTLTPGVYYFEMIASAHAPSDCGTCKGYAVNARSELLITR